MNWIPTSDRLPEIDPAEGQSKTVRVKLRLGGWCHAVLRRTSTGGICWYAGGPRDFRYVAEAASGEVTHWTETLWGPVGAPA